MFLRLFCSLALYITFQQPRISSMQREPKRLFIHTFSPFIFRILPFPLYAINFPIMKPTSTLTTSTQQQQQQQQTVSVPSLEPQVKTHLTATEVSFSSYLTPKKPNKSASSPQEHLGSATDDSELSIFDAQKYFSEGSQNDQVPGSSKRVSPIKEFNNLNLCDFLSFPRFSSASPVDRYGPSNRTCSLASSEASWNSQTGLLTSNTRGADLGVQTDGKGGSRFIPKWLLFQPKCPCSGKKSVRVKEQTADNHRVSAVKEAVSPKMLVEVRRSEVNVIPDSQEGFLNTVRGLRQTSDSHCPSETGGRHLMVSVPRKPLKDSSINPSTGFTFPILPPPSISSSSPPFPMRMPWNGSQLSPASPNHYSIPQHPGDLPRDALGVVKPPSDDFLDSRKSQENRIYHQQFKFLASFKSQKSMAADEGDELGSDASSDLFEIESISTPATYPITHQKQRDSLDEARARTPLNRNFNLDEKQGKDSGQEKAENNSMSSP